MSELLIVKIITKHESLYLSYLGIIWMLQPTDMIIKGKLAIDRSSHLEIFYKTGVKKKKKKKFLKKNSQKHLCWILFLIILKASRLLLYVKDFLIWNTYLLEYLQITASLHRASYLTKRKIFIKLVRITFVYERVPVLILQWK